MNPPILPNGTLVQLISTAEFDSHCRAPGDSAYLGKAPDGTDDIMDVSRRPRCHCRNRWLLAQKLPLLHAQTGRCLHRC